MNAPSLSSLSSYQRPIFLTAPLAAALVASLTACASMPGGPSARSAFSQASLPAAVQVPAGHTVSLETVAKGEITYECREKAGMPGTMEWAFVGPQATLADRSGRMLGRYFGPPATWASSDGSALVGAQVAVSAASAGSIPLQLVKTTSTTGMGSMTGHAFVQRVATVGGVAPSRSCDAASRGQREVVPYQADYIFWKPAASAG